MTQTQKPTGRDMRLKVTACRHVYTGVNKRGDQYTIYEIDAERPDGVRIDQKLRAFTALPIGQVVEVTVVPFNSTQHGRSFTLYPKNSRGGVSATDQLNEMRENIEELYDRLQKLTQRVAVLENPAAVSPPATPARAATEAELAARFGDEPPGGEGW